jgi:redox-sensitive bicupin YhaK (pirin superfamily)
MSTDRTVKKVNTGYRTTDGAGVSLVRVIGNEDVHDYDPFLMLDAFDSVHPQDYTKGFPWHPHRGMETITYLISGDIEHGDSLGNTGSIKDGDAQWMTAGSGIIHQEMPKASKRMLGVQLWLNLPAKDKMTAPKYGPISHDDIPVILEDNATVRIISGSYKDKNGAYEGEHVKAKFLDVEIKPDETWTVNTDPEDNLFLYLVEGDAHILPEVPYHYAHEALLLNTGDQLRVQAGSNGVRFFLLGGKRLNEPVSWGGPIVMNTRSELQQAFDELNNDTFLKG